MAPSKHISNQAKTSSSIAFFSYHEKFQHYFLQISGKIGIETQMVSDEHWEASSFIVALVAEDCSTHEVRIIKIGVSDSFFRFLEE